MNSVHTIRPMLAALALALCAACGTPLQLNPATDTGSSANANAPADANRVIWNTLKCYTGAVQGAELSNCTCSTDGNRPCPVYTADTNASQGWSCTTTAVSGGYTYSCECGAGGDANGVTAACSRFYDPADPGATQNGNTPSSTCQTIAVSFGFQTTCMCIDTNTAPCAFYQGNSYTSDAMPYVENCSSTLNASGATTVCTCNQLLQNSNATCPATFTPSSQTVTDLIY